MQADILLQLNSSINAIYSLLDNQTSQLNKSIAHLHQQIKSVIENNTQELDNTNSALQTQLNEVNSALADHMNSNEMIYQRLSRNISVLEYRVEQLFGGVFSELPASSCACSSIAHHPLWILLGFLKFYFAFPVIPVGKITA